MFVTNWISTTKIQKISEITNFFRHYFLSRTEVSNEPLTLKFTWYIDNNGDIYIRYNKSGFTYVMDLGSSQSGFYLGEEKGRDVFYGYMIGTGKAKGDVMQIDLERYDPSGARKKTRSAATDSVAPSFGKATSRAFMPHAIKKLPRR